METCSYYPPGTYVLLEGSNEIYKIASVSINIDVEEPLSISYFNMERGKSFDSCDILKEVSLNEYIEYLEDKKKKKIQLIQSILDVFDQTLNKDDWDFQLDESDENSATFYIKYNNIKIENKKGESHLIPEIFIKMDYDLRRKCFESIQAQRSIQTINEFNALYNHSHIASGNGWRSICWGDGQMLKLKNNISMDNLNLEDLRLFLFDLYPYLCWENLDSTCYSYISTINSGTRITPRGPTILERDCNNIINNVDLTEFIIFNEITYSFDINLSINFLQKIDSFVPEEYKCYYDLELNAFAGLTSVNTNLPDPVDLEFKFKGNDVFKTIIKDPEDKIDLSTNYRFMSPGDVNYFINYLKERLLETLKTEDVYVEAA